MRLPPLTDQELTPFVSEGTWVAKLATYNDDGTVRMTPLSYAIDADGSIVFTTWTDSAAVRNLVRDPRASVLIDKADQPFAGVHYTGQAEAGPERLTPQEYAALFGRYYATGEAAAEWYSTINSFGLGERAAIRFTAHSVITWDFAKLPA